eukprot:TRINITY_DN46966_c0_g1_i1.p1 TRINITY_DN46966_c0_g1~~TRINITY_DN46966_c0_g1_i1.p1  ORF type:complete len:471 (-),score=103.66 TRINITY_DN46966_c0_g1_i1:91-1503(-)
MGAATAALLSRASEAEGWAKKNRGPLLRKLFGAYTNTDIWAVCRNYRKVDDGNGYVSYDEFKAIIFMKEHDLLFVFDIFAQQNELIDSRELLTMICLFSSATLLEKGKFLISLFDDSKTGSVTGSELATACTMVCTVFSRCTGIIVRPKEVTSALKQSLPSLIADYAEPVELHGLDHAFNNERLISAMELNHLIPSIQEAYDVMPVAGLPPADSVAPPPPDWGPPETGAEPPPRKAAGGASGARGGQFVQSGAKKLSEADLAHLTWITRMEEDEDGPFRSASKSRLADGTRDNLPRPATRWMVIHGMDFGSIAKDLPGFRYNFVKSVSAAIGVSPGCIEVINVLRGSIIIHFTIKPPKGEGRDGETFMELLEQQIASNFSTFRRGSFADFAQSAELVAEDPTLEPTTPAGGAGGAASGQPASLPEALAELSAARRRIEELEASHRLALDELRKRDAEIARLSGPREFDEG